MKNKIVFKRKKMEEKITKMMKDRGYTRNPSKGDILYSNNIETVLIVTYESDIGISAIAPLEKKSKRYSHIIIIKSEKITPQANAALTEMSKIINVEIFDISDLGYNPTEHENVPKYTLLSKEESEKLLKMYTSKPSQFPKMLFTDPIRRYYGWPKGGIVKEVNDNRVSYRIIC